MDERFGSHVAFLGLGAMGTPMATNLVNAGFEVTVWNRTLARAEPLAKLGARVSANAAEAAAGADVTILMLESGPVVDDVLLGAGTADGIPAGATVIDMSSIPPAVARDHARQLGERSIDYLDAPVSGGTSGAADATLAIMVGGSPEVYERWLHLLHTLGTPTHVGPPGAGQAAKLVNQVIVGVTIGAVVEGLSLASRLGLDIETLFRAFRGGFADSRILWEHGRRIATKDFQAGGAIRIQSKDLENALHAAEEVSLDLPISRVVAQEYAELKADGLADFDHSALWLWYHRDADVGPGRC
jgi:2-hydroxy-3-oxopropionate reductase